LFSATCVRELIPTRARRDPVRRNAKGDLRHCDGSVSPPLHENLRFLRWEANFFLEVAHQPCARSHARRRKGREKGHAPKAAAAVSMQLLHRLCEGTRAVGASRTRRGAVGFCNVRLKFWPARHRFAVIPMKESSCQFIKQSVEYVQEGTAGESWATKSAKGERAPARQIGFSRKANCRAR